MKTTNCLLAGSLIALAGSLALAGERTSRSDVQARGDGGEFNCDLRMITPYWTPEMQGEMGDMLGMYASNHDGSEIAITSYSTYFIPGAETIEGHLRQIVVLNRETQEGELITVAHNSKPEHLLGADNHSEWYLDMSPNGRYVAFASMASNLVEEDVPTEYFQTYVRDRWEQKTYLVSKSTKGEIANDWGTDVRLGVSNNGRVAFASRGNNLHPDQPITMWAVYVHDVHTGVTELVSRDEFGNPATIDSWNPAISADGSTVAFVSWDALTSEVNYPSLNVYTRGIDDNRTELISKDANGQDRFGHGYHPRLSHDGNRVAFKFETTMAAFDPAVPSGWFEHLYVRDRSANTTTCVNLTFEGFPAHINPEGGFTLSGDGQHIAFETMEQVLPGEFQHNYHVYRRHVDSGVAEMVTIDRHCNAVPKMHDQMWSVISGDGAHVTWVSMWDVMMYEEVEHDWMHHLYQWVDPDYTAPVQGDLNGDGMVNIGDLLILLTAWGPCSGCDADLDGDGSVGVSDMLILLNNWS